MGDGHLLHLKLSLLCSHARKSDFLVKTPPSATSGIEPKYAILILAGIPMRMTVDHYVNIRQICRYIPFIVNHKKPDTLNSEGEVVGQILRPFLVIVASDDIQGSKTLQGIHNGLGVDIATVDNSIRLREVVQHLRAEQTMGVG